MFKTFFIHVDKQGKKLHWTRKNVMQCFN